MKTSLRFRLNQLSQ
ncbi:hypothetical protein A2U01_0091313, partial [Trifolium medium]|nr:hypothetical protein [Trifolium medium]